MQPKPLILVCNDDGVSSPGIQALISLVRPMGRVVVVAPDKPQSGTAHAVTINNPLRLDLLQREEDYEAYSCSGTPADCVKLAFKVVMNRRPDLLVSGINHGSNASINIIYSGTMAAVFEGAMAGVPSIGFSLCDYSWEADFSPSMPFVTQIIRRVISNGLPDGIGLNVNIPAGKERRLNGIRICRQANGTWLEDFDERKDPGGRPYFWLKGVFARIGNGEDTDEAALEQGYISVVPVRFDFTADNALTGLSDLNTDQPL
jgi:5'-nucleotidase